MCAKNQEHKQAHEEKTMEKRNRTIKELAPRCIAEVDLEGLKHNIKIMKSIAHGSKGKTCELMMTLSHDAYGHGAVQCTKLAVSQGICFLQIF